MVLITPVEVTQHFPNACSQVTMPNDTRCGLMDSEESGMKQKIQLPVSPLPPSVSKALPQREVCMHVTINSQWHLKRGQVNNLENTQ